MNQHPFYLKKSTRCPSSSCELFDRGLRGAPNVGMALVYENYYRILTIIEHDFPWLVTIPTIISLTITSHS